MTCKCHVQEERPQHPGQDDRLVYQQEIEPGLKVSMGFVDGFCVPVAEVKEFPQALDLLFCQCWDSGFREGEKELLVPLS